MAFILILSTPVLAVEAKTELWVVKCSDNGDIYLKNTENGRELVQAFRIDEFGNQIFIDLIEYANTLNRATLLPQQSVLVEDLSEASAESAYSYIYEEQNSYIGISVNGTKVTPDVVGPATISYGTSATYSASFGGSISLNMDMIAAVVNGASVSWSYSASSSQNFGMTFNVASGRIGYIQFKAYWNVSTGRLFEMPLYGPGNIYDAWGQCPKVLSNGFADGIYELIYK